MDSTKELFPLAPFVYEQEDDPKFGGTLLVVDLPAFAESGQDELSVNIDREAGTLAIKASIEEDTVRINFSGTLRISAWLKLSATLTRVIVSTPIVPPGGVQVPVRPEVNGTGIGWCFWIRR